MAGFQFKKQKYANLPEAQDQDWHTVISTTLFSSKKVTKAAQIEGAGI